MIDDMLRIVENNRCRKINLKVILKQSVFYKTLENRFEKNNTRDTVPPANFL